MPLESVSCGFSQTRVYVCATFLIKSQLLVFMSDGLTNVQIDAMGKRLMGSEFRGTCSKDELPRARGDGVYVINLQSSNQKTHDGNGGGTHWVSLLVHGNRAFYFDSFGFPPPTAVLKFTAGINTISFPYQVQPFESDLCGHYDLLTMFAIMSGDAYVGCNGVVYKTFNREPLYSPRNYTKNDALVKDFAKSVH